MTACAFCILWCLKPEEGVLDDVLFADVVIAQQGAYRFCHLGGAGDEIIGVIAMLPGKTCDGRGQIIPVAQIVYFNAMGAGHPVQIVPV